MRKVTMNEYIELIDELCAKCDSGELTEEGVNDILAEITISEWKSDPREPHDVPDDYIPPSSIYFSYEEVLIKEAEGIIHGYLPEIDGIIYED